MLTGRWISSGPGLPKGQTVAKWVDQYSGYYIADTCCGASSFPLQQGFGALHVLRGEFRYVVSGTVSDYTNPYRSGTCCLSNFSRMSSMASFFEICMIKQHIYLLKVAGLRSTQGVRLSVMVLTTWLRDHCFRCSRTVLVCVVAVRCCDVISHSCGASKQYYGCVGGWRTGWRTDWWAGAS